MERRKRMKKVVIGVIIVGWWLTLCSLSIVAAQAGEAAHRVTDVMPYAAVSERLNADCDTQNTCPDYSVYWQDSCPDGQRCIKFMNNCTQDITLSYQVGCNAGGTPGAPQCNCTQGPTLQGPTLGKNGGVIYWQIVNGNYDPNCPSSYLPACLTAGLTVMANSTSGADCTQGTRVEFTAGNSGDIYGKFDSYNISTQGDAGGTWYSVPVVFEPDPSVTDPYDPSNLNCRPLYCNSLQCPDAYLTSTTGGCPDSRSPQGNCNTTFSKSTGYLVELCPSNCTATSCPSCQKASSSTTLAAGNLHGKAPGREDVMKNDDLVGITSAGQIYFTLQALSADWRHFPGYLAQIATADIDGDFIDEIFGLTERGEIYYTNDLLPAWQWMPGILNQIAACDLNGDGISDLVGIAPDGNIYYTVDKLNWQWLMGTLSQLTCADVNGDGLGDIVGVTAAEDIYCTLDREHWLLLPGKLTRLASGRINSDCKADLVGLTSTGHIYYTLDLCNWVYLPGTLSQVIVGSLNSDLQGDLVGLSSTGEIFYTLDLATWNQLPGKF